MAVRGILKKDDKPKKSKGGLVFSEVINHYQEFDWNLPVLTISQPEYEAPHDPSYDDEVYWWEEEEEIIPWYEMEDESEVRGYTWDDVVEEKHSTYRTDAMDGLLDEWTSESGSGSDSDSSSGSDSDSDSDSDSSSSGSYEEETVSDDDSDYQLMQAEAAGLQLDVDALRAQQQAYPPVAVKTTQGAPAVTPEPRRPTMEESAGSEGTPTTPGRRRVTPRRTSRSANAMASMTKAMKEELAAPDISGAGDDDDNNNDVAKMEETPAKEESSPPPEKAAQPARRRSSKIKSPLDDSDHPDFFTPKPSGEAKLPQNTPRPSYTEGTNNKIVNGKKEVKDAKEVKELKQVKQVKHGKHSTPRRHTSDPSISSKKKKKRHSNPDLGKGSGHKKKSHLPKRQPRPEGVDTVTGKNYEWERPDWVKKNKLKQTQKGRLVRKGGNLAKPITMINRAMNDMVDAKRMSSFGRPSWTKKSEILKETTKGGDLKSGGNLARNITHIASDPDAQTKFGWEKPEWTKKNNIKASAKGEKIKKGEYISANITKIADDQDVANKYAWEKPEWTKTKVTKTTKEGEKMKKGVKAEIDSNEAKEKYGWEKPDWALKQFRRISSGNEKDIQAAKAQIEETKQNMNSIANKRASSKI